MQQGYSTPIHWNHGILRHSTCWSLCYFTRVKPGHIHVFGLRLHSLTHVHVHVQGYAEGNQTFSFLCPLTRVLWPGLALFFSMTEWWIGEFHLTDLVFGCVTSPFLNNISSTTLSLLRNSMSSVRLLVMKSNPFTRSWFFHSWGSTNSTILVFFCEGGPGNPQREVNAPVNLKSSQSNRWIFWSWSRESWTSINKGTSSCSASP